MSGEHDPKKEEGTEQPACDPEAFAEEEGISKERARQLIRSTDDKEELDSAAEAAKRWS